MDTPTLTQPISKPKEVAKPHQRIGDIENNSENERSFQGPNNPLSLPKFDYLSWIRLSDSAKFISREGNQVVGAIRELIVIDLKPMAAKGQMEKGFQKPDQNYIEAQYQRKVQNETAQNVQAVERQKEAQATQDAIRLEVTSQSDEQLAVEGKYQRLYKKVRTVYNIMSIVFNRRAEMAKKNREQTKPIAIAKGRASALNAAMEGGMGQMGKASANLSASGGGAG